MTMVTPSGLRDEILPRMSDCAWAEKPKPPCPCEMSMPRKPLSRTKRQMSSGMSCSSWRMRQSLRRLQSSTVGPSRKARSSSVNVIGAMRRSLDQSGVPLNSSASQPTVPACKRLALGLGDGGHGALERAIGGQRDVFALDLGDARHEQERGREPAEECPPRENRPMQMAVHEAHLRGEREDRGGERPHPSGARFIASAKTRQAIGPRRSTQPWAASTLALDTIRPRPERPCAGDVFPARSARVRLFALYGPDGTSTQASFLRVSREPPGGVQRSNRQADLPPSGKPIAP